MTRGKSTYPDLGVHLYICRVIDVSGLFSTYRILGQHRCLRWWPRWTAIIGPIRWRKRPIIAVWLRRKGRSRALAGSPLRGFGGSPITLGRGTTLRVIGLVGGGGGTWKTAIHSPPTPNPAPPNPPTSTPTPKIYKIFGTFYLTNASKYGIIYRQSRFKA